MNAGKLGAMEISHFNDLLAAARGQTERQRLLLVFASASLPAGATAEQKARFEAGESGELAPLMCVDKDPGQLADFAALVDEASTLGSDWALGVSPPHCPAPRGALLATARSTPPCSAWSKP